MFPNPSKPTISDCLKNTSIQQVESVEKSVSIHTGINPE